MFLTRSTKAGHYPQSISIMIFTKKVELKIPKLDSCLSVLTFCCMQNWKKPTRFRVFCQSGSSFQGETITKCRSSMADQNSEDQIVREKFSIFGVIFVLICLVSALFSCIIRVISVKIAGKNKNRIYGEIPCTYSEASSSNSHILY